MRCMSMGRINSPESIKLASELVRAFGGWQALEEAATRGEDGVLRVSRSAFEAARKKRAAQG